MNTLVELFDERALENVLGPDVFRPQRVIYLCPENITDDKNEKKKLQDFFEKRGYNPEIILQSSSLYKANKILKQLISISEKYDDCAIDVTGGTEAALFASGLASAKNNIPAFTYSRKKNTFYDIINAPFADNLKCEIEYKVEDFFLMTGGKMREGRTDNSVLKNYVNLIDPFFKTFLKHRRRWTDSVVWFQRVSQTEKGVIPPLRVNGKYTVKGERGGTISANEPLLHDLESIGFINDLQINEGESVTFKFRDFNVRTWLRDMGAVLELYTYQACMDADIFGDVIQSAIVDWQGVQGHDAVSNEIDVMAVRGVVPIFISCKVCDVKTEAINELAILRDRFGGKGAKAALVTAEPCNAAARHRAAQMGIAVVDLEELENGKLCDRIKVIMKQLEKLE